MRILKSQYFVHPCSLCTFQTLCSRALLSKRQFYHSHRVQVTDNIRPVFYLPVPSVQVCRAFLHC